MHDNARIFTSSSHPESSTDSQESDWSNHHLGKTLPSQALPQLKQTAKTELDSNSTSSHLERTNSTSSETNSIQSWASFGDVFYSESPQAFSDKSNQQDVTVEIQLLPELSQITTECLEEQNKMCSMDPFSK